MAQVRAKFQCVEKSKNIWDEKVKFLPVMSGSPENESFFKSTPSGTLEMGIKNPEAMAQFEVGKNYYIDITLAD